MIYPNNFERKLGFDEIRRLLRERCLSTLGKEKVDEIAFSTDCAQVNEWLTQVREFRRLQTEKDDFPMNFFFDVRQAVVLAQISFARDDSGSESELGLPVQVVTGSFLDSSGTEFRKMENYKLNRPQVIESGHPNMVFFEGDSLSLQVTLGMRGFINQANEGRNFKMMLRLGYPVLQAKDSTYMNYETDEGDTSYVFFNYSDYNRYDFTSMFNQPATLKLWLATKRGEE